MYLCIILFGHHLYIVLFVLMQTIFIYIYKDMPYCYRHFEIVFLIYWNLLQFIDCEEYKHIKTQKY